MMPIPFVLRKYGPIIRKKSKYAPTLPPPPPKPSAASSEKNGDVAAKV